MYRVLSIDWLVWFQPVGLCYMSTLSLSPLFPVNLYKLSYTIKAKNWPHSPTLLVSGEGPVWLHQEGDGSVPAVRAGLPAGAAADGTLQPSDGSVGTDRPAHPAGRAHTEPQAQTLGAEGVLRQGLWRCRAQCGGAGGYSTHLPTGVQFNFLSLYTHRIENPK